MNNSVLTLNEILDAAGQFISKDINPVIRHKLLKDIIKVPEDDTELKKLKTEVLCSGLVHELEQEQKYDGSWGRFHSKDYSLRNKFPTTCIAIDRALYMGLDKNDIMLFNALEYVKEVIQGKTRLPDSGEVNERWPAMLKYRIAYCLENIEPYSEYTDEVWHTWFYLINRVFRDGIYNYEYDKRAQYEVFGITGSRLVPIPFEFILLRRDDIPSKLEMAMLDYCWERHCINGYFWPEAKLINLPGNFYYNKTRRWLNSIEFFTRFRQISKYLQKPIEWVWNSRNDDGLWDHGPQIKDPWGYFRYLSEDGWKKPQNRINDCTVEVLVLLRKYIDSNNTLVVNEHEPEIRNKT